jgi:O-antigen/teichoic acid export membrane protein
MSLSVRVFAAALGFLSSVIVARYFGAEAFGLLGLVTTTLALATLLCLVGTDQTVVRLVATAEPGRELIPLRSALVLVFRTAFIGLLVAAAAFSLYGIEPKVRIAYLAVTLAVLPTAFYKLVLAYLRGRGRPLLAQAIEDPISNGLKLGIVVACALAGWTGTEVPVTAMFAALAICAVIAIKAADLSIRDFDLRKTKFDGLFSVSWKILLINMSAIFIEWSILAQLSFSNSLGDAGIYRAAWQIASAVNIAKVSFTNVFAPQIAKSWLQGDRGSIKKLWRDGIIIATLSAGPLVIAGIVAPQWILSWFGTGYDQAATALRILLVAQAFNIVTGPLGTILIMTKREATSLTNSMITVTICLPLCLYAIPIFGIEGAAFVQALSVVIRNVLALIAVRRILG